MKNKKPKKPVNESVLPDKELTILTDYMMGKGSKVLTATEAMLLEKLRE